MKRMKQSQGRSTAYHEAGHAVAAIRLGVGIGRRGVSIEPGEGYAGFVHVLKGFSGNPEFKVTGSMRLKAENHAIVTLAGHAAQQKFCPSSVRMHHAQSDRNSAADLMSYFVQSDRELTAYLAWLSIRAEQFIGDPASHLMIEAVVPALMQRKKLSASETKAITLAALTR